MKIAIDPNILSLLIIEETMRLIENRKPIILSASTASIPNGIMTANTFLQF